MMRLKQLITLLCLAGALAPTGCTSLLVMDKVLPPEVRVRNDQWKVVVLNRFNPEALPFKREKKTQAYHHGAVNAFWGALDAVDADSTFTLEYADSAAYTTTGSGQPLTPAQVQAIYSAHPHHLLLSLHHFDTHMEPTVMDVENEDGSVTKIADYSLSAESSWILYDSTGTMLDSVTLSREELYTSREVLNGLMAVLIKPAIGNAGATINALAGQTGFDYWQRLSPQPISLVRPYYSNKAFAPAAQHIAAGDWEMAVSLLKPLAGSQNKKEAARAAYNLAVVYEAMGNVQEAKVWAKEAAGKKNKFALQLLPDLPRQ